MKSFSRDELLKRIGAQLGAVEEVIDWAPKFEGAVIVRVVSCIKHENADKLSVCRADDGGKNQTVERGEDGLIQVVCGAPNVHAGMFAVWLAPGVTVPSSRDKDPFVLEAREIRGLVSNGMLASAHELGISDDHNGIVEIQNDERLTTNGEVVSEGTPFAELFGLDDFVIECENKMFTHRPDCFGNLGVAREIAAIFGHKFEDPEWYWKKPQFEQANTKNLYVKNEASELVPRFMAVVMENIAVAPSPIWLQSSLSRVGIKPINNVVDITNYVMHLTGQPLHAFDYDKLLQYSNNPSLYPRMSVKGEKLKLLGEKEIELTGEEIVISTDSHAVALAGVMGGAETEVDENTKTIVIECATFDMYSIRKTSMRFGLFTDAVTRFNKGQSPLQNDRVLRYSMKNMFEISGAQQASEVYDLQNGINVVYLDQSNSGTITTTSEFINKRLGSNLQDQEICGLLQNVHFAAFTNESGLLEITAPFWRMDIETAVDLVEEVGRLHGYDKLPVVLPTRNAKPTPINEMFELKQNLRIKLKEAGANEVLTYSFVHGDVLRKAGTDPEKSAHHIRNALSPDLQYYRTSLVPSLLNKIHPNIKAQAGRSDNQFALFEIGQAHVKGQDSDGLPLQMDRLAFVIAADDKTAAVKQSGAAYYLAKKYLDTITNGQANYSNLDDFDTPISSPYQIGRSAKVTVNDQMLGMIGEFSGGVKRALKLPDYCAGFEIDLAVLYNHFQPARYRPLPSFPQINQDLTVEATSKSYAQTEAELIQKLAELSTDQGYLWEVKPVSIFQPSDSDGRKMTFRIRLWHPDRTLTTEETNLLISHLN
ncbi:MAG: phenylalanine--tRNA ligase subunit beta [bacterium]|nr:phenylalanine--tRNA ligase subunit beta [bacterium]